MTTTAPEYIITIYYCRRPRGFVTLFKKRRAAVTETRKPIGVRARLRTRSKRVSPLS